MPTSQSTQEAAQQTNSSPGLRVIQLKAKNIKRLVAVDVKPPEDIVLVSGANGAGKTSLLDSMRYALCGKRARDPQALRTGTADGSVFVDLGEIKVELRLLEGGGERLTVTGADGVPLKSPQAVLDKLYNDFTFDPLAFTRLIPQKQREMLVELLGIGPALAQIAQERAAHAAARSKAETEVKFLRGQQDRLPPPTPGLPSERISGDALKQQLAEIQSARDANNQARGKRDELARSLEATTKLVDKQRQELAEYEARIAKFREQVFDTERSAEKTRLAFIEAEKACAALVDPDAGLIVTSIAELEQKNKLIDAMIQWNALDQQIAAAVAIHNREDAEVKECDLHQRQAIAMAQWPVAGMGFNGDIGVTYNGLPFEQLSAAEKLRISAKIGMSKHSDLRVMHIEDGSLLDSKSMDVLKELAQGEHYQLWIERVDETGKVGIYIEDGLVKSAN